MELGKNYEKVLEIADTENWNVNYGNIPDESFYFTFHQYSNADGDFDFEVWVLEKDVANDNVTPLINGIYDYWNDYDVDEHVYMYLDHTGHPVAGAPNSISDLVHDIEEWISWVKKLHDELELKFDI